MSLLKAHNLVKTFSKRNVVDDVSIKLDQGQVVGLLGANGAGKTTLFYMVVGLIAPDAGKITIGDQDITKLPMHERARLGIGYLPQEASVFRKLSVAENIMAILETKNLHRGERQEKLDQLLEEFHINHIRDSLGMSLSGGERRRVEIARALAADPKYILLDEPFAGVDPISIMDIKRIIEHLRTRGLGVLITDHNVRETLSACEYAYIVDGGNLICEGTPETVLENQTVRDVYLGKDFKL
jgi:lipopolysaccharide export system ATP-binding protein